MAEAPRPFDLSGLLAGICELTPTVTYHTTGGFPEEIFVDLSKEEIERYQCSIWYVIDSVLTPSGCRRNLSE